MVMQKSLFLTDLRIHDLFTQFAGFEYFRLWEGFSMHGHISYTSLQIQMR